MLLRGTTAGCKPLYDVNKCISANSMLVSMFLKKCKWLHFESFHSLFNNSSLKRTNEWYRDWNEI
jgi:hypothetical protein